MVWWGNRLEAEPELARSIAEAGTQRMSQMTLPEITECALPLPFNPAYVTRHIWQLVCCIVCDCLWHRFNGKPVRFERSHLVV